MRDTQDYLWDPRAPADPEIASLEATLRGHGARARGLHRRPLPLPMPASRRHRLRVARLAAGLAAAAALVLALAHEYRLSWPEHAAWPAAVVRGGEGSDAAQLEVGGTLRTGADDRARLQVARIGEVTLAPHSRVRLLGTRRGEHRLAMEHGRLHARIWAPPGHFGVLGGGAVFIDMGCEFELAIDAGAGTLRVLSGWVQYDRGGREVMVPAGHAIAFDEAGSGTPVREAASAELRAALQALDDALRTREGQRTVEAAARVAATATDADLHSLLSLLTRHPELAATDLYPRLAAVIGEASDGALHRQAWMRGDDVAIERWWARVPMPPKNWLAHWRDAF